MSLQAATESGSDVAGPETDLKTLKFLFDLFCRCTEGNPAKHLTTAEIYEVLLVHANTSSS